MKAKFLSVLLALTMVLSLLPTAVLAANGEDDTLPAAENNVITLNSNVSISKWEITKSVTLDLHGYTFTTDDCGIDISNGATLTIIDSGENGTLTSSGTPIRVKGSDSKVIINSGAIVSTDDYGIYALDGGTSIVNGGSVSAKVAALSGNNTTGDMNFEVHGGTLTAKQGPAIYMPGQVNLTVTGGTLNGGISLRMGQVNISGGTINSITTGIDSPSEYYNYSGNAWLPDALYVFGGTYDKGDEVHGNSLNLNITGGTFNCRNDQGSAVAIYDLGKVEQNANVTIKGGTFTTASTTRNAYQVLSLTDIGVTSPEAGYGNDSYVGKVETSITGGTFTGDISSYLPSDYIQDENGTVEKLGETNSVAKIGDTYFTSLSAAIDAATSGDTVTLLKDTTTDMITIAADKAIVLDTNGKTVTNSTGNYAINNSGTLTINGGGKIIRENAGNSAIRTIGKLTLENVTIETSDQMISVKVDENGVGTKGTLIVNDDTVLNAKNGQAIQSWGDVTINGGTMNGDVTAWSVKDWNPGDIIIKGGTINGDVIAYQRFRNNTYPDAPAKISIENGKVSGALTLAYVEFTGGTIVDLDKTSFPVSGSISITGGHFTSDPTAYKAEGLSVVASDVPGYTYTLKATTETSDADVVVTDAVASSVSDDTTKIPAADAASISDVINKAVVENVAESLTDDAKAELINKAGASTALESGDTVTIVVNVAIKAVASDLSNTNNATLTFEADPTATVYVNGEKKGEAQNVTNDMLNGSITVKLPLPAGFTPKQIAHKSDGYRTEYYLDHYERGAKLFEIKDVDGVKCAVFDITHFSTFVLSGTQTYVAPSRPSTSTGSSVTVGKTENGTITVSPATASKGTNVTITAKPADGYELGSLTATDANGSALALTDLGNGKYSFTMPDGKVEVNGTFVKKSAQTFVDVPENAYYAPAVAWAVEKGVTEGTSATTFSPDAVCTRAQIVTFLYRAAGSPAVKSAVNPFTDVSASDYYYNAVLWAVENGITTGTSETTFSPSESCTRAQCAAFLYRYEQSQGKGFVGEWMFQLPFTDVPAWCYESVAWCYMNGVTEGTSATTFSPDDACTRAQIVTFLYRAAQVK